MLWIILGDYGCGKTLRLVIEAFDDEEREIWGNFNIYGLNNYKIITQSDLEDIGRDKLLILDEMQLWIESRRSMSNPNLLITNIIDQADKRDIDIFGTIHTPSSVDKRFKDGCHRVIECLRIGRKNPNWKRKEDYRDFRFKVYSNYDGRLIERKKLSYERAELYWDYFDTQQLLKYPQNDSMQLDLIFSEGGEKAEKKLKEIASRINIDDGGITYPKLDLALIDLKYYNVSERTRRVIYAYLKKIRK